MALCECGCGNPNTDAICGRCGLAKSRDHFGLSKRSVFGVRSECRECRHNDRQVAAGG